MDTLINILRVVHILSAILMAWPFYALVAVNQRARLGPPLGDRTDTYLENIVKNRTIPCFVFQASVLVSGLAILYLGGAGIGILVARPLLGIKFVLLLLIAGILIFVHTSLQPRIDRFFAQGSGGSLPEEAMNGIGALRAQRKKLASICLFCVLTMAVLGIQVWAPFPLWLNSVLILGIAAFTWRAYKSQTPYGWV